MADDAKIRGQATLEWGDQIRFLARPLAMLVLKLAAFMVPFFGAIWAITLPDKDWLALRTSPLASFGHFLADAWPFYFGTLAALVVVLFGRTFIAFRRFPYVNRQLTYEVNAAGIVTRDAADFALTVPWGSIVRARSTSRILYLQTFTRAWRYLLWRAFAPEDRDQILRWATRQPPKEGPPKPG